MVMTDPKIDSSTFIPSNQDVADKPWRFIGYRGFSEFLASDDDFFVVRRFDKLAARVLLFLQWELTKHEADLMRKDYERSHEVRTDLHNGSFELDDDARRECIENIYKKLREYYDFTNSYTKVRSRPDATNQSKTSIQNWLRTYPSAVHPEETMLFSNQEDIFPIVFTSRTPLRRLLEKFSTFRTSKIFRQSKDTPTPYANFRKGTIYQSNKKVDQFVNATICVVGFTMLAVPLWILFFLSSRKIQLAVITIFIGVFLGIMQSVNVAKPFESLAATAAYSAVLMVFMQIGPQTIAEGK